MKKHTKDSPLDWVGSTPFFVLWGVGVVGPFFTGVSAASITVAVILYYVRMFFVTGFFHRYFSHRSFEATRFWQFIYAACTCTAVQKGPLWWAYTHRHHHKTSDTEEDFHSNFWWGFLESHVLWFLRLNTQKTDFSKIKDLAKYPELVLFENKFFYLIPPTLLAYGCYRLGDFLGTEYSTSGMQMLMVGFFTSTFALHHGTFTINSISHMWGKKVYETGDKSLNNWFLAVFITIGEGWHNNHHHKPTRIKQGHEWWQIDITYYILECMRSVRIIHSLRYT